MNIAHRLEKSDRTEDVVINENVTFEGLLLSPNTLDGLKKCGFQKPSPIQLRAIPLGKCGFDLIVEAKSGTGKTAVFGIIALEMINLEVGCQVVILAPTREIASQIAQVLTAIGSNYEGLKVEIVMGGTNLKDDVQRLKGNKFQILVGSPGRMKHLIKENIFPTDAIRLIVVDEADKLIEDSFQKDINYIFSKLPHRKQVIAASATYTPQIRDFLSHYMRSASHVRPNSSNVLLGISQYSAVVSLHHNNVRQKSIIFDELLKLLSSTSFKQCLVFTNHQIVAKNLCKSLTENGWPARYLSGMQSQSERLDSLHALQTFSCRILVATDLAARGIDAANVDLVINHDPPYDLPTYLHRIGRAGRYGSKGTAVTILPAGKEEENFQCLLKDIGALPNDINHVKLNIKASAADFKETKVNVSNPDISKSDILSIMISSPVKDTPIECFDDILMEYHNQISVETKHNSLETFDSLMDSLNACLETNETPSSETSKSQMDYSIAKFLHSNNIDFNNKQNDTGILGNVVESEQNDLQNQDDFLLRIKNRCTVRNSKNDRSSDNSKRTKTDLNKSKKIDRDNKNVKCDDEVTIDKIPNRINQYVKRDNPYDREGKTRHKHMPKNHLYQFDYNNFKAQLSRITQQIEASVYINTLFEINQ